jgi:hypothetical protein
MPLENEEAAQSRSWRSDSGREVWRKIVGVAREVWRKIVGVAWECVKVVRRWIGF